MEKNDLYEIMGLGTDATTLDITEMNVGSCYMSCQKLDKIRCSRTPNEQHELKRFKNQYIVIYVSTKIPGRMIIVPVSIYIYTLS